MDKSSRRTPANGDGSPPPRAVRLTLLAHLERARDDARKAGVGDAFVRREMDRLLGELFGDSSDDGAGSRSPENLLPADGLNALVRARYGYMLYNRNDIYVGRAIEKYGEYSEAECSLFAQICRPGATVVEVGANMGAHTLALSKMVGDQGVVHAFEPQRILFQILCANVALNSRTNVHCHQAAVGARNGVRRFPPVDYATPGNFGGASLVDGAEGEAVRLFRLDDFLELSRLDLLKIDVEGMEGDVLAGARQLIARHRPIMYVENDREDRSEKLIRRILKMDYEIFQHAPLLFNADNFFNCAQNVYPQIASFNVLCLPQGGNFRVEGLKRVTGRAKGRPS